MRLSCETDFVAKDDNFGQFAADAAQLALSAINAQRETFRDEDCVRVHPIITKGGDLVNIIPAEVCLETYVRAKTPDAILDAAAKVDRSLRGAAMAMGCRVEIETVPGNLPLRNDSGLGEVFRRVAGDVLGAESYREYEHAGGSMGRGAVPSSNGGSLPRGQPGL